MEYYLEDAFLKTSPNGDVAKEERLLSLRLHFVVNEIAGDMLDCLIDIVKLQGSAILEVITFKLAVYFLVIGHLLEFSCFQSLLLLDSFLL